MSVSRSNFTGEPSLLPIEATDLRDRIGRLNASWQKQAPSILNTAKLAGQILADWPGTQKELVALLAFEKATFNKLCKIGSDERLYKEQLAAILPPHFSLLYALTKLDDTQFAAHLEGGHIHPRVSRKEIQSWLANDESASTTKKLSIRVDWPRAQDQLDDFMTWVRDGENRFGVKPTWPPEAFL